MTYWIRQIRDSATATALIRAADAKRLYYRHLPPPL